jgi:hypothetical protein
MSREAPTLAEALRPAGGQARTVGVLAPAVQWQHNGPEKLFGLPGPGA